MKTGPRARRVAVSAIVALLLAGCATTPTGRSQLTLFPSGQMAQMGDTAYQKVKQETPVSKDPALNGYVQCVTRALTKVVSPAQGQSAWQVTVFQKNDVNAFALPGGNIGVYMGLLKVADTPGQLAAVVGHEIGHVEAHHANARLSAEYATQAGLQVVSALAGSADSASSQRVMSLLGLGAQVGIILPYSRAQESEADLLGLRYMAQAGFDPQQAVRLWQNMQRQAGAQPPEFLSTHPSGSRRIEDLQQHMSQAMTLYRQARAQGRIPDCTVPK